MDVQFIRAQVTAMQTMLDAILGELAEAEEAACPHPADELINRSTMGHPLYECKVCGAMLTEWPKDGEASLEERQFPG
jgi:hypothetical protein